MTFAQPICEVPPVPRPVFRLIQWLGTQTVPLSFSHDLLSALNVKDLPFPPRRGLSTNGISRLIRSHSGDLLSRLSDRLDDLRGVLLATRISFTSFD